MLGSKMRMPVRITRHHRRQRPAALLSLAAVGLALVVAGCGAAAPASSSRGGYPSQGAPPTPTAPTKAAAPPAATAPATSTPANPPASAKATKPVPGIPQQNGGDADPDNNGGPDDGDGAI
jgi:hypothetical protein